MKKLIFLSLIFVSPFILGRAPFLERTFLNDLEQKERKHNNQKELYNKLDEHRKQVEKMAARLARQETNRQLSNCWFPFLWRSSFYQDNLCKAEKYLNTDQVNEAIGLTRQGLWETYAETTIAVDEWASV